MKIASLVNVHVFGWRPDVETHRSCCIIPLNHSVGGVTNRNIFVESPRKHTRHEIPCVVLGDLPLYIPAKFERGKITINIL